MTAEIMGEEKEIHFYRNVIFQGKESLNLWTLKKSKEFKLSFADWLILFKEKPRS